MNAISDITNIDKQYINLISKELGRMFLVPKNILLERCVSQLQLKNKKKSKKSSFFVKNGIFLPKINFHFFL